VLARQPAGRLRRRPLLALLLLFLNFRHLIKVPSSNLLICTIIDYEVSFLRLIEKLTNGTTIEISYTGTTVLLHPGLLPGGTYTHTCPTSRGIGYFLEPLVVLGCFGKRALEITLDGITGEEGRDLSVSSGLFRCVKPRD
jgi:hypothetical protein